MNCPEVTKQQSESRRNRKFRECEVISPSWKALLLLPYEDFSSIHQSLDHHLATGGAKVSPATVSAHLLPQLTCALLLPFQRRCVRP